MPVFPPFSPIAQLASSVENLVFLSASRQVETEVFPIPLDSPGRTRDVGVLGQYASWWLYTGGDSPVDSSRRNRISGQAATFRQQINSWCNELFPGAEVNSLPILRTTLMQLQLRSGPTAEWTNPANIGYGISYAFPILVAGLCSNENQPLIIDSPEAHLHPKGQSAIGRFLAQMASAGSQILIETHSDHLLNGVRLALREGIVKPEDVAIYFFSPEAASHVTKLSVDKNGSLSHWPEGFFDQSERDLAILAGWSVS
jgi:predicted ATPase